VLLAVTPTSVTEVAVVMVMVVYPFEKVADPVPLVVDIVNVIGVVFVDGLTVAVVGTGFPKGTKSVFPKVTVGLTSTPPPGVNPRAGHLIRESLLLRVPVLWDEVEPAPAPLCVP
jgi:hypothetical protein